MSHIRTFAKNHNLSLLAAASVLVENKELATRAHSAVRDFITLIANIEHAIKNLALSDQFETCIEMSGLIPFLKSKKTERAETRIENISELINAAYDYRPLMEDEENELTPLQSFLADAALESGDNQASEWEDSVQLMTMHSAKGLEFKLVFMAGMEDGLFPHQRSILEPGGLEEERRLCYVAITRSMQDLIMSYTENRMLHGFSSPSQPSRFLFEIPETLVSESSQLTRFGFKTKQTRIEKNNNLVSLGQQVDHPKFGEGIVIGLEGDGDHARVQVNFESAGIKWLVLGYAKLKLM
mgnify:FL=1